jgi:hypothetical protein
MLTRPSTWFITDCSTPYGSRNHENPIRIILSVFLLTLAPGRAAPAPYPENLRFDFTATGDYILAHSFFERSRRRSAMLRELKSRNPNIRI